MDYVAMVVGYMVIGLGALFSLSWAAMRVVEALLRMFGLWSTTIEIMYEIVKRRKTNGKGL